MKHVCALLSAILGAALFTAFSDAAWLRWLGSAVGAFVGYQLAAFVVHVRREDPSIMLALITVVGKVLMPCGLIFAAVSGFKSLTPVPSIAFSVVVLVIGYFCTRIPLLSQMWMEKRAGGIFSILLAQTIGWSLFSGLLYLIGAGVGHLLA